MSRPQSAQHTTSYELNWPANLEAGRLTMFLQALYSSYASKNMRFIILANSSGIHHHIVIPSGNAANILRLFKTFLPEVELAESRPIELYPPLAYKLRMSTKNRVLNTEQPELVSYIMLNSLANIQAGEEVTLEWVLGGTRSPVSIGSSPMHFETTSRAGILLESFIRSPKKLDGESHASMQAKHGAPKWKAMLFVGIEAGSADRSSYLINQVAHAIRSAQTPGAGLGLRAVNPVCMGITYDPFIWSLLININELTGLLAFPLGNQPVHGVQRATSRHIPLSPSAPNASRILAVSNVSGSSRALTLSPKDGLLHTHVIGPTGAGKSTLLLNLITQDINHGRGVVVVDPKGDLINAVLQRITASRREDVVVIDPSNNCPVGLNPLARHNQPASLIADDMLSIFRGLYGSSFGPRSQDILHAGLLTLCSKPGMSLCSLPILYTNAIFRNRIVNKLSDPLGLGSFWGWYNTLSDAERNRVLAPVMNKLRAFLMRPSMRYVIGQGRPKFDMGEIVSGKKIVLVNLAKGTLGPETSRLFGSLVVSQVWQAIKGRATMPMNQRTPIFTYVDEVQDYLHLPTDIGEVLEQSRSYGMGLILANQHLGQLPPSLRSSVFSNARSRVCFQLSHEDAVAMSRSSSILQPSDFENLSRYNIYARLAGNGQVLPWASGKTLEPSEIISNPATILELSQKRYGRDGAEVEAELLSQISGPEATKMPVGIKRKIRIGVES